MNASQLVAQNHETDEKTLDDYAEKDGTCCFCGLDEPGLSSEKAISHEYFTNYDLIQTDTGHVCRYCAYCMDTRTLKTGHWYATDNTYERFSTGNLYKILQRAANGELGNPLALHISPNPIKAMHAYIWAPVVDSSDPLVVSYGQQQVLFEWETFEQLVADIETLRESGFRVKDIRSGEPRVNDLESVGLETYQEIENRLQKYRGGNMFEIALTTSTT
jgi:hypothetical protein